MKKSAYAKIGAFAIASIVLAAGVAALSGKKAASRKEAIFETYIEEAVQGVSEGSAVKFRGIQIGNVKDVDIAANTYGYEGDSDVERRTKRYARVVFAIDITGVEDTDAFAEFIRSEVADGLHVYVKSQGITGLSYIDLDYGHPAKGDIPFNWEPKYQYIPSAPSIAKTLTDVLQTMSQEIHSLSQIKDAVTNLTVRTTILADTATGAINTIEKGLAGVPATLTLATNTLADADAILRAALPAASALPDLVSGASNLVAEATAAIAELGPQGRAALSAAADAASKAGETAASLAAPINDVADNLARAAEEISALAAELRADPSILLKGKERDSLK
ncbi:MAG: MCE family protein [Kiritimatiellae bacterium]|nr:MCE family protein [Kiritimatiellia bacterium]